MKEYVYLYAARMVWSEVFHDQDYLDENRMTLVGCEIDGRFISNDEVRAKRECESKYILEYTQGYEDCLNGVGHSSTSEAYDAGYSARYAIEQQEQKRSE